jgi:hypothetical protein
VEKYFKGLFYGPSQFLAREAFRWMKSLGQM